jgi:GTP-binding protein
MGELEAFSPELAARPMVVALSKADLTHVREGFSKLKARFKRRKIELHLVSAATGEGVRELLEVLWKLHSNPPSDE